MTAPNVRLVPADEIPRFLAWLGDTPESAMSHHRVARDLGVARVIGAPGEYRAAVVQGALWPDEPVAFGSEALEVWGILEETPGWTAVNASTEIAPEIGRLLGRQRGVEVSFGPEHYFVRVPGSALPRAERGARILDRADLALMIDATTALAMDGWRFGTAEALLVQGIVAGVVVDAMLVAVAFTSAITPLHAEIGVVTRDEHQRKGFATHAAAVVISEVEARRRIPVWSTAADNAASLAIARRLGFREIGRRVFVNRCPAVDGTQIGDA